MKSIAKRLVHMVEFIERHTPQSFHIFHIEDLFVALVLVTSAFISRGNHIEWIGVLAVFISFKHTVIAFRLEDTAERMADKGDTAYNSHGKQTQYFYLKETLWFIYFAFLGAYSALVGVVIFLLYPLWHDIRQKYHTGTKHIKKTA